jgi:hypothetical protein
MSLMLHCSNPECGATLNIPDSAVGKKVRCPQCGSVQRAEDASAGAGPANAVTAAPKAEPEPMVLEEVLEEVAPVDDDAVTDAPRRGRSRRNDDDDDRPVGRPDVRGRRLYCPKCDRPIEWDDEDCRECDFPLTPVDLQEELEDLTRKRSRYQMLSMVLGVPGLILAVVSGFQEVFLLRVSVLFVGFVLFGVGIAYAVAYKRDNLVWALLGFMSILGLVVLACLPDQKGVRLKRIKDLLYELDPPRRRDRRR